MIYVIEKVNGLAEIVDPIIEIVGLSKNNPAITSIDFPTLKYDVDILLIIDGRAKFLLNLTGVQAESLDFSTEGAKMPAQVLEALNVQFAQDYVKTKQTSKISEENTSIAKDPKSVKNNFWERAKLYFKNVLSRT